MRETSRNFEPVVCRLIAITTSYQSNRTTVNRQMWKQKLESILSICLNFKLYALSFKTLINYDFRNTFTEHMLSWFFILHICLLPLMVKINEENRLAGNGTKYHSPILDDFNSYYPKRSNNFRSSLLETLTGWSRRVVHKLLKIFCDLTLFSLMCSLLLNAR